MKNNVNAAMSLNRCLIPGTIVLWARRNIKVITDYERTGPVIEHKNLGVNFDSSLRFKAQLYSVVQMLICLYSKVRTY